VPIVSGWRRFGIVVVALAVGAAARLIRDMLRDLDRSETSDPWGPHRKGF
jgi:hypothetical protein